ncbi:MAG: DUF4825 domain-containing protein [Solobacterium sp.]|nr:DUF4825 domain-containing protein [Solobacterium sp.]
MTYIPCEVIQDLLPSYVDGLTSPETNELIAEHLKTCETCRAVYQDMLEKDHRPSDDPIEIDFLRTTRMRTRRKITLFTAALLTAFLLTVGLKRYAIGDREPAEHIRIAVRQDQDTLDIFGMLEDGRSVKSVSTARTGTVLDIEVLSVPGSVLNSHKDFYVAPAAEQVRTIRLNGQIVWEDGVTISAKAAAVLAAVHPYVGDMSANAKTAYAAEIPLKLGSFTNELQTAQAPYGWTIYLQDPLSDRAAQEAEMDHIAAILIAATGNLSEVTFSYAADGVETTRTITEEMANELAGFRVKDAAGSYALMQKLVDY